MRRVEWKSPCSTQFVWSPLHQCRMHSFTTTGGISLFYYYGLLYVRSGPLPDQTDQYSHPRVHMNALSYLAASTYLSGYWPTWLEWTCNAVSKLVFTWWLHHVNAPYIWSDIFTFVTVIYKCTVNNKKIKYIIYPPKEIHQSSFF